MQASPPQHAPGASLRWKMPSCSDMLMRCCSVTGRWPGAMRPRPRPRPPPSHSRRPAICRRDRRAVASSSSQEGSCAGFGGRMTLNAGGFAAAHAAAFERNAQRHCLLQARFVKPGKLRSRPPSLRMLHAVHSEHAWHAGQQGQGRGVLANIDIICSSCIEACHSASSLAHTEELTYSQHVSHACYRQNRGTLPELQC